MHYTLLVTLWQTAVTKIKKKIVSAIEECWAEDGLKGDFSRWIWGRDGCSNIAQLKLSKQLFISW